MVLSAYPILANDNQNMLQSGVEVNNIQNMNPMDKFINVPHKNNGVFIKETSLINFTNLTADEKILVIYEQLMSMRKIIDNLMIIIVILLFILFNKKKY
jgi:hypothetical protein